MLWNPQYQSLRILLSSLFSYYSKIIFYSDREPSKVNVRECLSLRRIIRAFGGAEEEPPLHC
ncbi:hypothetical protein X556_0852 [Chlamydia pneumoniae B21]|nr:hypothetical protein X556_0852 [Chlamydia pneumoniae B21]